MKVAQQCPTLCDPVDYTQSMEFSKPEYWSRQPFPSPGDLPNSGIKPRSPTLQADFLPAEPQRKAKNTGVGCLFLLQGIFPTQELNQGLLHHRQILYQLSYQGSPLPLRSGYHLKVTRGGEWTSLVVQQLRLRASNATCLDSIPSHRTRSLMLQLKIPHSAIRASVAK